MDKERIGADGARRTAWGGVSIWALGLLLALALAIGGLPSAFADDTEYVTENGALRYTVNTEDEVVIVGYTENADDDTVTDAIEVLSEFTTVTAISIGERAFEESSLENITIPEGVVTIGQYAFRYSTLQSVSIPASVQSIDNGAFAYTGLETVTFAEGSKLTHIGESALPQVDIELYGVFSYCSLTSIDIPAGVELIGSAAFAYCYGLVEVSFEDDSALTEIGDYVFEGCTSLEEIELPAALQTLGGGAFWGCEGLESVSFGDGSALTEIGDYAFSGCAGLAEITLPAALQYIGFAAFAYCENLASVSLEDGSALLAIGEAAFEGCDKLEEFTCDGDFFATFSDSGEYEAAIGYAAFADCSALKSVDIPAGVEYIYEAAFINCEMLEDVVFAEDARLLEIGRPTGILDQLHTGNAFGNCASLTKITIPSGVLRIGDYTFSGCAELTEVSFAAGSQLTEIGEYTFYGCTGLEALTFGDGAALKTIAEYAFYTYAKLKTVNFGNNSKLTSIGDRAFEYCESLAEIELPVGLTAIGDYAFQGCASLIGIELPAALETLGDYAFSGCGTALPETSPESAFAVTFAEGSKLTEIGEAAFAECGLVGIEFSAALESIASYAFGSCEKLASVSFEAGSKLTAIGKEAFCNCDSLTGIELPAALTAIGGRAFAGCVNLSEIEFPVGLTAIGDYAFEGCKALSDVSISWEASALTIGYGAFSATALRDIFLPPGVSDIDISYEDPFTYTDYTDDAAGVLKPTAIHGYYDSYALWWARTNGHDSLVMASTGVMKTNQPDLMYKYIPYEFIAKTLVPGNEGLRFWLTDGSDDPLELPEGLYLVEGGDALLPPGAPTGAAPGTIYGAPLDYEGFEGGVTFTMHARNIAATGDDDAFTASVEFTIKLAPTPDNAELEANNIYEIADDPENPSDDKGHIGVLNIESGEYEITGYKDAVGNQILYIKDGPFALFDSFWIDGVKKIRAFEVGYEYIAGEGSTRVTVLAQTIQDLDKGEHTAAAAFRQSADSAYTYSGWQEGDFDPKLDIVAQKFTVNLSDRPEQEQPGDPGDDDNGGENNGGGGDTPDPGDTGDPGNSGDPTGDEQTGGETPPDTAPEDPNQGGQEGGSPGEQAGGDNSNNSGGNTAGNSDAAGNAPAYDNSGNAPATVGDASSAANADAAAAQAPTPGAAADTAQSSADPAGDAAGSGASATAAIDGLPRDANGLFYFELDGSGRPFEARIDIPLAEFENLYFDGELWARGPDYEAREGSTLLTVAAEKLSGFAYGAHELAAHFTEDRIVSIAFELRGNAAKDGGAEIGPDAARADAADAKGASDGAAPARIAVAAVALLLLAGIFVLIVRKRYRSSSQ